MGKRADIRSAACKALLRGTWMEANNELYSVEASLRARCAENEDGVITSIISKDEAQACEIDELVEKRFSGSLPAFVAAFAKRRDMSERELDEVQRMIDSIRNGGGK